MIFQIRLLLITLILLGFNDSFATVYFVSTTGNNGNRGTISEPFKTVAFAVDKMVAGDTTYVRGGVYQEDLIRFKKSGTQSAPIKLLSYSQESPIIDFRAQAANGARILIQNANSYKNAIGWITIEGFEIRYGRNGIKFYNLHNSVIRRNWIHHSWSQGILGNGGHHNVFDRNRVNHNGAFAACAAGALAPTGVSMCNLDHGFYMFGNYYTVTNNLFYDNLAYGLQINGSESSIYNPEKQPAPEFAGATNWVVANNTFAYNAYRPGIVVWSAPQNIRIENNIFYENCVKVPSSCDNVQGIKIDRGARGVSLRNNLFFASGTGATLAFTQGAQVTQSGNVINSVNPNFVNAPASIPASPNFALRSNSPAINQGLTITTTNTDFLGRARPQGAYDMGAYEYLGSGLSVPKIVTNFRISE